MNRLNPTSRYEVYKDKRYYEETNTATGEKTSVLRGVKSWQEAYVVLREYEAVLVAHKTVVGGVMPGDGKKGAKALAIDAVDGRSGSGLLQEAVQEASTSLRVSVAALREAFNKAPQNPVGSIERPSSFRAALLRSS